MASSIYKWIVLVKCVLISIGGILSIAMLLKFSIPFFNKMATNHLPLVMSFLKPPYLILLINLIILTLFVSSRLQRHNSDHHHSRMTNAPPGWSTENGLDHDEAEFVDVKPVLVNGIKVSSRYNKGSQDYSEDDDDGNDEIKQVIISSSPNNNQLQRNCNSTKLLFHHLRILLPGPVTQKRRLKATSQGRTFDRKLGVAQEETLESAWKRIMEGRRQVNQSDTWQNLGRHVDVSDYDGSLALIKEASLSKDELNQRAEAFISQVNHDMRKQRRQESLEQHHQMMLTLGGSR